MAFCSQGRKIKSLQSYWEVVRGNERDAEGSRQRRCSSCAFRVRCCKCKMSCTQGSDSQGIFHPEDFLHAEDTRQQSLWELCFVTAAIRKVRLAIKILSLFEVTKPNSPVRNCSRLYWAAGFGYP